MSRLARVAGLALGAALVAVPVSTQPASAASCAAGSGVSVVVDYNSLGGGVATSCVADGGGDTASSLFAAAGHAITYAQRQPGFVCRVDGAPADDPCVNASPADRFWSLWWSDGTSGTWTYSSQGVTSLKVPEGGSVAFSFDDVDGEARPSATPPKGSAPSASPTPDGGGSGSMGGSGSGSPGSSGPGASTPTAGATPGAPGASDSADAAPGDTRDRGERERSAGRDRDRGEERESRKGRNRQSAGGADDSEPTEERSDEAAADDVVSDPDAAPVSAETGGLPVWVAPVALLVLAAGAGGAVIARRRSLR